MSTLVALIVGCARTWVGVYTLGLAAAVKEARRREIDSDVWEQQWLASRRGESVHGTAGEILTRTLFGIFDDIMWRLETGASPGTKGITTVNDTWPMRIGFIVVMLPLAFLIVNGVAIAFFGAGDFDNSTEHFLWGLSFLACPLVAAAGLWLCRPLPKLGLAMAVLGAIGIVLLMFWMWMITAPIGLVIIVFAIKRSGLVAWPFRPSPTGAA